MSIESYTRGFVKKAGQFGVNPNDLIEFIKKSAYKPPVVSTPPRKIPVKPIENEYDTAKKNRFMENAIRIFTGKPKTSPQVLDRIGKILRVIPPVGTNDPPRETGDKFYPPRNGFSELPIYRHPSRDGFSTLPIYRHPSRDGFSTLPIYRHPSRDGLLKRWGRSYPPREQPYGGDYGGESERLGPYDPPRDGFSELLRFRRHL